ncbi:SGNH/GDSL hydrolase family protein [Streptomyces sp. NBC_00247]|uniref:SGNH/GDSL hydrolase family protein n=1 Tax=Streptomyces sp. NBC_00247 TaxID=2975689 RepID=UPI003FA72DEB
MSRVARRDQAGPDPGPREPRRGYGAGSGLRRRALLPALVAGTAVLAAALALGTERLAGPHGSDVRAAGEHPAGRESAAADGRWVATWTGAPVRAAPVGTREPAGTVVRNAVHSSAGGVAARITLSNLFGTGPLVVDHARVNSRPVTFGGAGRVTVPAGGHVVSDAVRTRIAADSDLVVSFRTPVTGGHITQHPAAFQTSYLVDARTARPIDEWRYLTAVDVFSTAASGTVVAFGDSLTAGSGSTPNADRRWPDLLADRLKGGWGVANQGISGNRLLSDGRGGVAGVTRFERDVLGVTGVRTVIVALGINDAQTASPHLDPQQVVDALRRLTGQAHARGLRVIGVTLTPFEGIPNFTRSREAVRQEVNEQIRAGGVFDAYVDFDEVVRDLAAPERIRADYDSGDHLHFNDQGYQALADSIGLGLLTGAPQG